MTAAELDYLADQDVVAVNSTYLGETLAVVALFREASKGFVEADVATLKTISPLFALSLAGTSTIAVALLFLMFLFFEISVVVLLPLATEVLPQARGTMMSSYTTAFAAGNALGVLLGGWMFRAGGMRFNGIVALALSLTSALLIWRFVSDDASESALDQPELR